jgi:hypothetical protein
MNTGRDMMRKLTAMGSMKSEDTLVWSLLLSRSLRWWQAPALLAILPGGVDRVLVIPILWWRSSRA